MLNQIYLPLAALLSLALSVLFLNYVGATSSSLMLALFGALVLLQNVVILPLVFKLYVSKPNVDMAYYFLGLVGVVLFFEAERFEREISELRQATFDTTQSVQRILQSISIARENAQGQLDAANRNLEDLRNEDLKNQELFSDLSNDQSAVALSLAKLTKNNVEARLSLTSPYGDLLELRMLNELSELGSLSDFVDYHGFGPRQANLVRLMMDPRGQTVPLRVRECLLAKAEICNFPLDRYHTYERSPAFFLATLQSLDDGTSLLSNQLEQARQSQSKSEEKLSSALAQRDIGSTLSDGIFVYADRFRRSFWPYAIIIAFSLKLASANSARSNEARASAAKAQEIYNKAALTLKPDGLDSIRAMRKAQKMAQKRLRRAKTLDGALEASETLLNLVEVAEKQGQRRNARAGIEFALKFTNSFRPFEETNSGSIQKAKLLRRLGDILIKLSEVEKAQRCFSKSYNLLLHAQRSEFSEDGVFELATAIVRIVIIETKLGNKASVDEWLGRLGPLRRDMNSDFNNQVEEMLRRVQSTFSTPLQSIPAP